ncbi:thioredoxin family protein [Flaviaesturariibacter flavus]|uniref:Thioredoxin family protein n=1 Tax=Flaviaesturariibacter flavus TaxID=2502780 RepID=A0A4R1BNY5_9BACT|nr:thioredoxin family protein [Flaviaesturariibacter flavus]TCJ19279.1 thioredoxin family protein [Flaviaesturariibacter flavus]
MKKSGMFLFLAAIVAIVAFRGIDELPIGASLPKADVKLKDISGKSVSLKEAAKENGLLVMFSCNTCPYVIRNQERTVAHCNYALDKKIGVVLINSNEAQRSDADSYDAMKEYAKEQAYKWHYVVDEKSALADAFGAKRTPECFLFDKSGKLVYHGAIDNNPDASGVTRKHLRIAMDEMLAGKDVSQKTSNSVGCSIKRI